MAATIIFRSLLHWHSFEAERTNIFDRVIQAMSRAIEHTTTEDNRKLAYWLSNTTYLLFLLNKTLKTNQVGRPPPSAPLYQSGTRRSTSKQYVQNASKKRGETKAQRGLFVPLPRKRRESDAARR